MKLPYRLAALLLLNLLAATSSSAAPLTAVRELGQPDFTHVVRNRVDGRGLAMPSGVAVDRSRTPNALWVLDADNHRALGWRDVARAAAGAPADVVLGQPDSLSNECNSGGVSARSLCLAFAGGYPFYPWRPGLAVDGAGNVWIADRANFRVLGYRRPFDTDVLADVVIGQDSLTERKLPWERSARGRALDEPSGLATNAAGDLFIVDGQRVLELDNPFTTDSQLDRVYGQSTIDDFDPSPEADPASLSRIPVASGVAVDGEGRLYVGDVYTDRVLVWDAPLSLPGGAGPANHVIVQSGGEPCGPGCSPYAQKALAVTADGDLWVSDRVLDLAAGKVFGYRTPFGPGGDTTPDRVLGAVNWNADLSHVTDGQPLYAGGAMAFDASGTLWLTDSNRVLGFRDPWNGPDQADRVVGQMRLDETSANLVDRDGFASPQALALDASVTPPHLYVLDRDNSRVLGWADAEGFANGQPADLVIGQPDRFTTGCNRGRLSLASLCSFEDYAGLAVDDRGTLWVADSGNSRVLGYRAPFREDTIADRVLGQRDGRSQGCARSPRGLCVPGGVAVDAGRNVYVTDIFNNRIVEYDDPFSRDGVADRVIGSHRATPTDCHASPTCFYEVINHYGIYQVYGGPLAIDSAGRLLVGKEGHLFVFDHPRRAVPRARALVELPSGHRVQAVATDSSGRIYLTVLGKVQRYRADGVGPDLEVGGKCGRDRVPRSFDAADLCSPTGLAVSPAGELFVSDGGVYAFEDPGVHRVVVYDLP